MRRFLGRLICRILNVHDVNPTARRCDARKVWVIECSRCGAELDFTLPCPEYPDESMGNCGDVQCRRTRAAEEDGVCDGAPECIAMWSDAQCRFRGGVEPGAAS